MKLIRMNLSEAEEKANKLETNAFFGIEGHFGSSVKLLSLIHQVEEIGRGEVLEQLWEAEKSEPDSYENRLPLFEGLQYDEALCEEIASHGGMERFLKTLTSNRRLFRLNKDHAHFAHGLTSYADALSKIQQNIETTGLQNKASIHVLGLGDVGSTMALGLCLYGKEVAEYVGLFDLDENRMARFEQEFNQIAEPLSSHIPRVKTLKAEDLFQCDLFAFTASVAVPPLSVKEGDVRLVQFEANAKLVKLYIRKAIDANFKGIFAIVSDPVDMLCRYALKESQLYAMETGKEGLTPEQIRGYGLGVMNGRAAYYAEKENVPYHHGRVYGPHGKGLVVANDYRVGQYDDSVSQMLMNKTITANLEMRKIGFKPYIAPAIASGAISLIKTLAGEWHYSCVSFDGFYYGCLNRKIGALQEIEHLKMDRTLQQRILESAEEMNGQWESL